MHFGRIKIITSSKTPDAVFKQTVYYQAMKEHEGWPKVYVTVKQKEGDREEFLTGPIRVFEKPEAAEFIPVNVYKIDKTNWLSDLN